MVASYGIGDLVAAIKNGCLAKREKIEVPHSAMKEQVLELLKQEGYIHDYQRTQSTECAFDILVIKLKYFENASVIRDIRIISKPGKRRYCGAKDIPVIFNGLGMVVLSTSAGILFDRDAREKNIGGELLLQIF